MGKCIIIYKGKKYSEEQFKEYFINNKQEFSTSIAKNKDVIDSFKRKMEGIDYVFSQSPELASIGNKAQYLQYLSTIFPNSKIKDIVYHGSKYGSLDIKNIKNYEPTIDTNRVGIFFSERKDLAKVYSKEILKEQTLEDQKIENDLIRGLSPEDREWYFRGKSNMPKEKYPVFSAIINVSAPKQIPLIDWDRIVTNQKDGKGLKLKQSLKIENYDSIKIPSFIEGFQKFKDYEDFISYRDKKDFYNLPQNIQDKYFEEYRNVNKRIADYYANQYAVFEPEQIHILSSKADIEGFKEFVNNIRLSNVEIKKGVPELFESNPELTNAVYEAVGIRNPNITVLPNGNLKIVAFRTEKVGPTSKGEYQRGKGLYLSLDRPYPGEDVYTVEIEISPKNLLDRKLGFGEISEDYFIDEKNKRVYKQLDTLHEFKQSLGIKAEIGSIDGALMNELVLFDKELIDKALASKQVYNPQQKQQAQQQYSQYLDTIFPDSKVKDIVYHGTDKEFENYVKTNSVNFDNFRHDAFYFTSDINDAISGGTGNKEIIRKRVINNLINFKNPLSLKLGKVYGNFERTILGLWDGELLIEDLSSKGFLNTIKKADVDRYSNLGYDGIIIEEAERLGLKGKKTWQIVFEPEQIHILSSKADIQGFKEFVQGKQFQKLTQEEKAKTIEQVTREHRSITALKDLAAKLAHRIGGKVEFENRTDVDWKGYNQGNTSVLNEAYMTPDTPFHEILAHPIIRAIKNQSDESTIEKLLKYKKQLEQLSPETNIWKIGNNNIANYLQIGYGDYWMNLPAKIAIKEINDRLSSAKTNSTLYQSLLKELETGKGKEVLDRIKRDYIYKRIDVNNFKYGGIQYKKIDDDYYSGYKKISNEEYNIAKNLASKIKYTLEEQQEEAIVTLLGMMAADKLDAKKDATLISKLKELWKQISDFVKSLLRQDGIKIDELPITTTLNDLAEIMAYGNNKIILPGYKVEYDTPLGNKYDTLEEVNNEVKEITALFKDLKLEDIDFKVEVDNNKRVAIIIKPNGEKIESDKLYEFIQQDKEYAQSEAIINEYKKINNIQYDPEEVYSRGQGFYSSIGAYSNLELDLLLKNLIQHIEDLKKVGGEFRISAFTKPIDKRLKHIEGTGDRVRFVIYPKSEHIKWAAPTDVYSGSVWDAHEKVSKDKKSELLGVSFTKAPALRNINEVSPNLADIIDNLSHVHNEAGLELTLSNFEIEYDENIDYSTKQIINSVNRLLQQKRLQEIDNFINTLEKQCK